MSKLRFAASQSSKAYIVADTTRNAIIIEAVNATGAPKPENSQYVIATNAQRTTTIPAVNNDAKHPITIPSKNLPIISCSSYC